MTTATLVRRTTADGLMEFLPAVPLGTTYVVDPATRRLGVLFNTERRVHHVKELIDSADGTWLPVECLLIYQEVGHA